MKDYPLIHLSLLIVLLNLKTIAIQSQTTVLLYLLLPIVLLYFVLIRLRLGRSLLSEVVCDSFYVKLSTYI